MSDQAIIELIAKAKALAESNFERQHSTVERAEKLSEVAAYLESALARMGGAA